VVAMVTDLLSAGHNVLDHTSRELPVPLSMSQLQSSCQVSSTLVELRYALPLRPGYIIGKGGITSIDLATDALMVRRADVIDQIVPGVPVWRLGPDSRNPGLPTGSSPETWELRTSWPEQSPC
jgi:uncharacterized protein YgbK (DUF1537 family)